MYPDPTTRFGFCDARGGERRNDAVRRTSRRDGERRRTRAIEGSLDRNRGQKKDPSTRAEASGRGDRSHRARGDRAERGARTHLDPHGHLVDPRLLAHDGRARVWRCDPRATRLPPDSSREKRDDDADVRVLRPVPSRVAISPSLDDASLGEARGPRARARNASGRSRSRTPGGATRHDRRGRGRPSRERRTRAERASVADASRFGFLGSGGSIRQRAARRRSG